MAAILKLPGRHWLARLVSNIHQPEDILGELARPSHRFVVTISEIGIIGFVDQL